MTSLFKIILICLLPALSHAQIRPIEVVVDKEKNLKAQVHSIDSDRDGKPEAVGYVYGDFQAIHHFNSDGKELERLDLDQGSLSIVATWPVDGIFQKIRITKREETGFKQYYFYYSQSENKYEEWHSESMPYSIHFKDEFDPFLDSETESVNKAKSNNVFCSLKNQQKISIEWLKSFNAFDRKAFLDQACSECLIDKKSCGDDADRILNSLADVLTDKPEKPKKYLSCLKDYSQLGDDLNANTILINQWKNLKKALNRNKISCDLNDPQTANTRKAFFDEKTKQIVINRRLLNKNAPSHELSSTLFHEILHSSGNRQESIVETVENCCANSDTKACKTLGSISTVKPKKEYLKLPGIVTLIKMIGHNEDKLRGLIAKLDSYNCDPKAGANTDCIKSLNEGYKEIAKEIKAICTSENKGFDCQKIEQDFTMHISKCDIASDGNCLFVPSKDRKKDSDTKINFTKSFPSPETERQVEKRMGRSPASSSFASSGGFSTITTDSSLGFSTKPKGSERFKEDWTFLDTIGKTFAGISPVQRAEAKSGSPDSRGGRSKNQSTNRTQSKLGLSPGVANGPIVTGTSSVDSNSFVPAETEDFQPDDSGSFSRIINPNLRRPSKMLASGNQIRKGNGKHSGSSNKAVAKPTALSSSASSSSRKSRSIGKTKNAFPSKSEPLIEDPNRNPANVTDSDSNSRSIKKQYSSIQDLLRDLSGLKEDEKRRLLSEEWFQAELKKLKVKITKGSEQFGSQDAQRIINLDQMEEK